MTQQVLLKRSSVPGKIPTTGDLALGEVAINTYDGRFFFVKNDGTAALVELLSSTNSTLDSLSDVIITTPIQSNEVLLYNGTDWVNSRLQLSQLSDFFNPERGTGDVLTWYDDGLGTTGWTTSTPGTLINDDTTTNADFYVTLSATSFGSPITSLTVSSVGLTFNPSTGTLTAVSFAGNGSSLTSLNASNLSSGTVNTARLGSGTASSSTYLRGDGTWATIITGATISNDTTTNATYYPTFATATSGTLSTIDISSSKLTYNPSTGVLSATGFSGSGASLTSLTAGNLLGSIPSAVLGNSTAYVGTTAIALNRASANQALTGILSVALPGSTSGTITLTPAAVAGTTAITIPATAGTLITTGDTGTVTNTMLAGSIANAKLTNSSVTVGSTSISLGASATTITGLTSVTSTGFTGALTGNASTATAIAAGTANQIPYQTGAGATSFYSASNYGVHVYGATGVPQSIAGAAGVLVGSASAVPTFSTTPSLTGTNFTGIPNGALSNSSVTIGSTAVALGATATTIAGLTSVTSTGFTGALTGNATSASALAITNIDTASTYYIPFTSSTSGNAVFSVDATTTPLSYNPNTGVLSAAGFSGPITGSASQVAVTTTDANATYYPTIVTGVGSNMTLYADNVTTPFFYNPNTGAMSVPGTLTVTGDLTVNGTTTTVNSTTLIVNDKNVVLGSVGTPTDTTADGGGFTLKGATDKTFNWVASTSSWTSSEDLNIATGKVFRIAGTSVLSATALGSGVLSSSLTSVGTIGTGTWQGSVISSTYGGTGVNNGGRTLTINTNSGIVTFSTASTTLTVANNASVSGTNTGDQTITLTGDVTGSGTGSFATTLANSGVTAGTYNNVTVNAKGLVTTGSNVSYVTSLTDTLATVTGRGATTSTAISITNATASSSSSTGALIVTGGAGIGGSIYSGGTFATGISGAAFLAPGASAGVELGSTSTANTPYIDFHSSANAVDYDSRLLASGGSSTAGNGNLSFYGGTLFVNGATASTSSTTGALVVTGGVGIGGNTYSAGDIHLVDNKGLYVGTGNDFSIIHDGTDTTITNTTVTSGKLNIFNTGGNIEIVSTSSTSFHMGGEGEATINSPAFFYTDPNNSLKGFVASGTDFTTTVPVSIGSSPTATTAQLNIGGASGALGNTAKLRFSSTFATGADTGSRLTSSLISGFSTGTWGTEYLDIRINNAVNDTISDANQTTAARVTSTNINIPLTTASSSTTTGALTVAGGIGVAGTVTSNSVTTNSVNVANGGVYSATLTTSTTTANQVVDTTASASYRVVKYLISVKSGTAYQTSEINAIHDGTTVTFTENNLMNIGSSLGTFDLDISGGNIRLLFTPVNAVTTVKVIKTAIYL